MIRRHAKTIGALLTGAVVTAAVLLLSRPLSREPRLPPSEYLPSSIRGLLDKRMARHAGDMNSIAQAVIFLDFKSAAEAAERVAGDANLARPLGTDASELNARLPPRFFELQDQLRSSASRVAAAARSENIDQLGTAYSDMTRACVACHGVYLKGDRPTSPSIPDDR